MNRQFGIGVGIGCNVSVDAEVVLVFGVRTEVKVGAVGDAFQFFDASLSKLLNTEPVYYGPELMTPANERNSSSGEQSAGGAGGAVFFAKTAIAPVLSARCQPRHDCSRPSPRVDDAPFSSLTLGS